MSASHGTLLVFNPIPGFKQAWDPTWSYAYRIAKFGVEHLPHANQMLLALDKAFYSSCYKVEFTVKYDDVVFNLYTDNREVSEYVNRLFVGAE